MDFIDLNKNLPPRAGEGFRLNTQRYFHVMNQGWYLHTRDGIRGPYLRKEDAAGYLEEHIARATPDPSNTWRLS